MTFTQIRYQELNVLAVREDCQGIVQYHLINPKNRSLSECFARLNKSFAARNCPRKSAGEQMRDQFNFFCRLASIASRNSSVYK